MSVSVNKNFIVKVGELYVSGLARGIRAVNLSQFKQNAKSLDSKDVAWIKERVPTAEVYQIVTTVEESLVKEVKVEKSKKAKDALKEYPLSV